MRRLLLFVLVILNVPSGARAQDDPSAPPVTLVADVVEIVDESRVTATGSVEIFSGTRRITAEALSYDRRTENVTITGPITLQDGEDILVFADSAEIDPELRNGVMTGARLVLRQQLQIAGAELRRSEDRFSELRSVVASSCRVCNASEDPLWEIRARRVIHDEDASRVWFYDAQFRVFGLPVFYLPVFRAPDGTNPRVSGFLVPSVRTTSQLGPGIKLPYFFTLGRSADLTLTPYVATDYTRTLEARYRQMFTNGEIEFQGALSVDSIAPGELRGYLFGEGQFDIPRGYELNFDIQTTTDDPYLQDYDYSSEDRLASAIGILRTRPGERIEATTTYYHSLRPDEDNDLIPTLVANMDWNRRWYAGPVGGWLDFDLIGHGHMRPSTENILGRDMAQMRAALGWSRRWTQFGGFRFTADIDANADLKYIAQDNRYEEFQSAVTPSASIEMAYPLSATGESGARYLLEPLTQLVWTAPDTIDSPNDDSTLIAFDTGNLLATNRFPGLDRYEEGTRMNVALRWSRLDPEGWTIGVTLGKVYRFDHTDQFPVGTGLAGDRSDWMTEVDLDLGSNLLFRNLMLLDSGFEATLNETRISWEGNGLDLAASYVWQSRDRALDLDQDVSEVAVDAEYDINNTWSAGLDFRRDLIEERTNRAEFALTWRNECVRVDLSAVRRFRATEDIEPTTSYGLSVTLAGFGANEPRAVRTQRCAG